MCHHIDEDKAIMLSTDSFAVRYPFEYQKADRLVYCNYLEHLLLHIKIAEESDTDNSEVLAGIGGAVNFIVRILNGFYSDKIVTQEYLCRAQDAVIDDYDSYILYLNKLWKVIKNDRVYSSMYTKEKLAQDWDGNINNLVLNDIKD